MLMTRCFLLLPGILKCEFNYLEKLCLYNGFTADVRACGRQTFAKLANAYRQAIDCVTAADVLTARHTPNTPQRFAALQTASSLFPFRKSKFWTSASFVLLQKYKRVCVSVVRPVYTVTLRSVIAFLF